MLPFLKLKQDAASSSPVESIERTPDESSEYDSMESAAQDIMDAIKASDPKALAAALRAAFELMDSQPHTEGEHI